MKMIIIIMMIKTEKKQKYYRSSVYLFIPFVARGPPESTFVCNKHPFLEYLNILEYLS